MLATREPLLQEGKLLKDLENAMKYCDEQLSYAARNKMQPVKCMFALLVTMAAMMLLIAGGLSLAAKRDEEMGAVYLGIAAALLLGVGCFLRQIILDKRHNSETYASFRAVVERFDWAASHANNLLKFKEKCSEQLGFFQPAESKEMLAISIEEDKRPPTP